MSDYFGGDGDLRQAVAAGTIGPFVLRGGSYWVESLSALSGLFTMGTNPTAGQVVVIGSVTYRFESSMAQANDVKLGASQDVTLGHLIATLNGTGTAGTDYFAGTVSPAVQARAQAQTPTQVTNHSVTIYATTIGTGGNITSTTTVTSATWTAATLTANSGTVDLKKLGLDGTTYTARATQITLGAGQQTLSLPPGTYEWIVAGFPVSYLEVTRIPTAIE
jgi:hypothetical protein